MHPRLRLVDRLAVDSEPRTDVAEPLLKRNTFSLMVYAYIGYRLAQLDLTRKYNLEDGDDGSLLGRPHVDEDVAAAAHRLGDQLHHLVHREDVANVDVPAVTPGH